MSGFIQLSSNLNCCYKQNTHNGRKGQDYTRVGSNEDFEWLVVADGHGNSTVINIIKEFDWVNHIKCKNFHEILNAELKKIDSKQSGSTLSVVKIYPDRFETFWVGDSSIKIYHDRKCIWDMKKHNKDNFNEMERIRDDKNVKILEKRSLSQEVICCPLAINSKEIKMIPSPYFLFGQVDKINMTHALGHMFLTGTSIDSEIIAREQDKKYKVVVASDGLWDVSCSEDITYFSDSKLNSDDHVSMAKERWRQEWIYCGEKTKFPLSNHDDVAIATWSN
jgi:serine/threonine protein phosphatase PrpC